jgi:hypothetical protein
MEPWNVKERTAADQPAGFRKTNGPGGGPRAPTVWGTFRCGELAGVRRHGPFVAASSYFYRGRQAGGEKPGRTRLLHLPLPPAGGVSTSGAARRPTGRSGGPRGTGVEYRPQAERERETRRGGGAGGRRPRNAPGPQRPRSPTRVPFARIQAGAGHPPPAPHFRARCGGLRSSCSVTGARAAQAFGYTPSLYELVDVLNWGRLCKIDVVLAMYSTFGRYYPSSGASYNAHACNCAPTRNECISTQK